MDKLTVISGTLFFLANIFAILSLVLPDWIVSDVGGDMRLGLLQTCTTLQGRPPTCFPPRLQPEWLLALVCIVLGCVCITATTVLLGLSRWNGRIVPYARWMGFSAMLLFCLAAVIFPVGFSMDEIGGEPYQLPSSHQVGLSYIFFVLALWITVISELFAGKVCMPHF
ncbi:hypothetical protein HPB51_009269 [Rhipicephalus microplus]|uniref:Uncharacterized protein n=1 Tax=Rhipicephalus microplus TaxID=6941 RepID=A0A9J6F0R2_RHIMP|nr:uncharacterized protein C16orf52 homolog B-like [Rhipicephalus microplus]KAH8040013.1 hypothetical protein HPB51_009269 [Rhipicephalus microplus]